MNTVRWGILSTAQHGANVVIPAIHDSTGGEVVAAASRDETKAHQFADSLGIPTSYGSYEALLADPNVDAIYNPLPNHLHKEWTIKAAQAGKHVLCEKPIALNAAEAEEMVAAFRDAGLKLAETFQWRHHPQGQRVRELVQERSIGDLKLINASFTFVLDRPDDIRWKPEMGGGALYDIGCYPISVARYITGQEPQSVTAQAHWSASGVDDLVVMTLRFPGDVLAVITCSFLLPFRREYEALGTDGSLAVLHAYNPMADRPGEVLRYGLDKRLLETITLDRVNSYVAMVEDFNTAILEDRDPLFPPEDAIANMRVIDAIFRAAREGSTVEIAG
jgi:xylose dehydrogenase (NAD/NADP)